VVPWEDYPLTWEAIHTEDQPGREPTGGSWVTPTPGGSTTRSSNSKYVSGGGSPLLTDTPAYVNSAGNVQGHATDDALASGDSAYWLSTGQDSRKSFVWWECDLSSLNVAGLKLHTLMGPYKVYISIHNGTEWVGKRNIPYTVSTGGIDINADIPYVMQDVVERGELVEVVFPRVYTNCHKIRLTFTRLRLFDGNYPWRAGLKQFQIYTGSGLDFDTTGTVSKVLGNYTDWTAPVKWVCAWAGFWWPNSSQENVIQWADSYSQHYNYPAPDPNLVKGKIWGCFQPTGTSGVAAATPDNFDKQPLMETINYIRNIVGFMFRVDEHGSVVWRMPNLYAKGNYLHPHHLDDGSRRPTYVDEHITIDETTTLIDYGTELSSANLRERIFVANSNGKYGTVVKGYHTYNSGLRRVAGWTDEHFKSNLECRVAADMIAAQQMFSWRRATLTMPAHPGLQVDDQVRIYERVTNETFYHYVLGIESAHDVAAGTWTQTVTTHWLGERPSDAWVVRVDQLDAATQNYLSHLGTIE
jgi:hypothetical protein